jgi:uncharacterized membrane protein YdfJ with MMPL/SSD domain
MENKNNKKLHAYDWMIIAIAFLLLSTCYFGCTTYNLSKKPDLGSGMLLPEQIVAQNAQKRYDSLTVSTDKKLDSLELAVAESKKKSQRIIIKYRNIHDTISITPQENQIQITKMLCPATGDSVNLQEINYCLASGKQSEDLLKNTISEINAKDQELRLNEALVIEGLKNMEAKDSLNDAYKEVNADLDKNLKKQTHRKRVWRSISVGSVFALIAAIAIIL